jgi:hypothetical protein
LDFADVTFFDMLPLIQNENYSTAILNCTIFPNPAIILKTYQIPLMQGRSIFPKLDKHQPAGAVKAQTPDKPGVLQTLP